MTINIFQKKAKDLFDGGLFHIFLGNTLIKMIGFISSIVIVRLVTKQEYAHLAYASNIFSYISLFSGLGLSTALLKFCSTSTSREQTKSYLGIALIVGAAFQMLASLATCILFSFIEIPFVEARVLIYLSVFLPVLSFLVECLQIYWRSQLKNQLYSKIAVIQSVSVLILSVALVLLCGISGAIFAQILSYMGVIVFCAFRLKIDFKGIRHEKLKHVQLKAFFTMGLSLMIASFFSMVMPSNEMAIVNTILKDEIITANYKVAVMIPSQIAFITGSLMIYYFPIVARMTSPRKILRKTVQIAVFCFIIVLIITIVGMILTPILIHYIYGEQYVDAIPLAYVFWVVYALNAGFRMVPINLLPAIGKNVFNASLSIISCVVHLFLDVIFIKYWGIWGAAYALIIVYLISGTATWLYFFYVCKKRSREEKNEY